MDKKANWHGVDRESIPWFPVINEAQCIGCELCFITCGKSVYEMGDTEGKRKAKAVSPYACMVGCSTCANICPTHAISFPDPSIVLAVERESKIFSAVHKEADARREKQRSKALESCDCIKRRNHSPTHKNGTKIAKPPSFVKTNFSLFLFPISISTLMPLF